MYWKNFILISKFKSISKSADALRKCRFLLLEGTHNWGLTFWRSYCYHLNYNIPCALYRIIVLFSWIPLTTFSNLFSHKLIALNFLVIQGHYSYPIWFEWEITQEVHNKSSSITAADTQPHTIFSFLHIPARLTHLQTIFQNCLHSDINHHSLPRSVYNYL